MPSSFRGLVVFVVTSTIMFAVGSFVYIRVVQPMIDRVRGAA
jgi:hypothetical protein